MTSVLARTALVFFAYCLSIFTHSYLLARNEARPACAHTPPLYDLLHDVAHQWPWLEYLHALELPDRFVGVLSVLLVLVLLSPATRRHVMVRRFLLFHGVLSLVRGVVISLTTLPSPNPNCRERVVEPGHATERALGLTLHVLGLDSLAQVLAIRFGQMQTCCDLLISGHTSMLMVDVFVLDTMLASKRLRWALRGGAALVLTMVICERRHYTIDVVITVIVAHWILSAYHRVADIKSDRKFNQAAPWLIRWVEQRDEFPGLPGRAHLLDILSTLYHRWWRRDEDPSAKGSKSKGKSRSRSRPPDAEMEAV